MTTCKTQRQVDRNNTTARNKHARNKARTQVNWHQEGNGTLCGRHLLKKTRSSKARWECGATQHCALKRSKNNQNILHTTQGLQRQHAKHNAERTETTPQRAANKNNKQHDHSNPQRSQPAPSNARPKGQALAARRRSWVLRPGVAQRLAPCPRPVRNRPGGRNCSRAPQFSAFEPCA